MGAIETNAHRGVLFLGGDVTTRAGTMELDYERCQHLNLHQQVNDLATLCQNFVTLEYKKVEMYIWGFVQPIQGLVTTSRPSTYDSAKRLAFRLIKQEIR